MLAGLLRYYPNVVAYRIWEESIDNFGVNNDCNFDIRQTYMQTATHTPDTKKILFQFLSFKSLKHAEKKFQLNQKKKKF